MLLEIIGQQIADPFRLGLLFFLVLTARNTAAATGWVLPIAAGILFVAVIIPLTFAPDDANFWNHVLAGLVTNSAVAAILLVIFGIYDRSRASADRS